MSLIETETDSGPGGASIMFVKWENDVPDRCRQVSIDRNGGIVWNMALGVEWVSLSVDIVSHSRIWLNQTSLLAFVSG